MVTVDVLVGPRLKIERANRHIEELARMTDPLSREFYTVAVERRACYPDDNTPGSYLNYYPLKPIPETLAVIIGDTVHNLRCALDHTASAIIRTKDPRAEPHFPMFKEREKLEGAKWLAAIEEALPGSRRMFLENVRPEGGANDHLWRFNDLSNTDKHNLLIPTVTLVAVNGINADVGGRRFQNLGSGGNAAHPIGIIAWTYAQGQIAMDQNFKAAVQIKFGAGTPFEDEPVIPTLLQMSDLVSETLNAFERLITA